MTDDRLKLILSYTLGGITLLGMVVLIALIGIKQVEEKTSYGLMPLVVALSNLCIIFGNYAWQVGKDDKEKKE